MRVAELMQTKVITIAPESSIGELVRMPATDVLQAAGEKDDTKARSTMFEHTMVRDIMTPNPQVIGPDADARQAAQQMLYTEVRRLFVEDHGRLVGVISQTDIAHAVGLGRL